MKVKVGSVYRSMWAFWPAWLGVIKIELQPKGVVEIHFRELLWKGMPRWAWGIGPKSSCSAKRFLERIHEAEREDGRSSYPLLDEIVLDEIEILPDTAELEEK